MYMVAGPTWAAGARTFATAALGLQERGVGPCCPEPPRVKDYPMLQDDRSPRGAGDHAKHDRDDKGGSPEQLAEPDGVRA
jgi:hypothetical protein